jgi:thioredoxin 1
VGEVQNITDNNFEEAIINGGKPAIVDFGAEWCGPCKTIEPFIDEMAKEYGDRVTVGRIDIDRAQKVAQQFGIMSVPTVIFVKGGKEVHRFVGVQSKEKIADLIQSHLL